MLTCETLFFVYTTENVTFKGIYEDRMKLETLSSILKLQKQITGSAFHVYATFSTICGV